MLNEEDVKSDNTHYDDEDMLNEEDAMSDDTHYYDEDMLNEYDVEGNEEDQELEDAASTKEGTSSKSQLSQSNFAAIDRSKQAVHFKSSDADE